MAAVLCAASLAHAVEFTQVSWGMYEQEFAPSWAPGGQSIVAETRFYNGEGYLPLVNVWPVIQGPPVFVFNFADTPAWSPDGQRIALRRGIDATGVWSISWPGGARTQINSNGNEPSWSSDGHFIAYTVFAASNYSVWQYDLVTAQATRVTFDSFHERTPDWSPDGTKLVYASNRTGNWDIWVHDLVQNTDVQITTDPATDEHPSWSPDGRWITFMSTRSGNPDIWVKDLLGQVSDIRITTEAAEDRDPDWSPDGTAIAFSSDRPPPFLPRIWVARDLGLPDSSVPVQKTQWGSIKSRYRR